MSFLRLLGVRASAVLATCLFGLSQANADLGSSHYAGLLIGKSIFAFGSSDLRDVAGFYYGYQRYQPRFQLGNISGFWTTEAYLNRTNSLNHYAGDPASESIGTLFGMRWLSTTTRSGLGGFFDLGWGFRLQDRPTLDLPSELNSTPWAAIGARVMIQGHESFIGLRFVHVSNGGTVRPNRGQNEIMATVELRL